MKRSPQAKKRLKLDKKKRFSIIIIKTAKYLKEVKTRLNTQYYYPNAESSGKPNRNFFLKEAIINVQFK